MHTTLRRSADRKVTPLARNGQAVVKNAFGLPAGLSCPGMTTVCERICYAGKLEVIYKGVRGLVQSNYDLLISAPDMVPLLDEMITDFERDC